MNLANGHLATSQICQVMVVLKQLTAAKCSWTKDLGLFLFRPKAHLIPPANRHGGPSLAALIWLGGFIAMVAMWMEVCTNCLEAASETGPLISSPK